MKKLKLPKSKIPASGDTLDGPIFAVMGFLGLGAIIGAGISLWEKGREYGARETIKQLKGNDNER